MVKDWPLRDFLTRIERHDPFTYTRWGTGEWHAVFSERNGFIPKDGSWYFHAICRDISSVLLRKPQYSLGLPSATLTQFDGRIENYIDGAGMQDLDWTSDDSLRPTTIDDMHQLLSVINHTNLILVGPPHLKKTWWALRYKAFVSVPPRNAYLCKDEITANVLSAVEDVHKHCVVSVSAGVTATLVLDRLHDRLGTRHTLIDFGSVWDSFVRK